MSKSYAKSHRVQAADLITWHWTILRGGGGVEGEGARGGEQIFSGGGQSSLCDWLVGVHSYLLAVAFFVHRSVGSSVLHSVGFRLGCCFLGIWMVKGMVLECRSLVGMFLPNS